MDARKTTHIGREVGKLSFFEPEYTELLHPGQFMQLKKAGNEEIFVGRLHIDHFYHRLRLPENL